MSTSFYDLLKYAKTGIASPEMTAYDKMRAIAMAGGGAVKTLIGVPPLSFKANGEPLISWSMLGNGRQVGTPTFCGTKTENLFDSSVYELVPVSTSAQRKGTNLGVLLQGTYTLNAVPAASATAIYRTIKNGSTYTFEAINSLPYTFTADGVSEQIIRTSGTQGNTWKDAGYSSIMLNAGNEPFPYEQYGHKIQITCAGQTIPIYIGDPLRKALDGSDTVDVLSSAGTITRVVDAEGNALATPTTQIVDVPEIPTVKGQNTLTVDTELQPSSMTVNYKV